MFEAFRASRQRKEREGRSPQAATPSGEAPKPPGPAPAEPQKRTVPDWHRGVVESDDVHVFGLGERANVVFALSYNALMAVIIVFVIFAVLMCFLGYTLGSRPATTAPEESGPVGVKKVVGVGKDGGGTAGQTTGGTGGAPPVVPKSYWTVRVLTVENTPERERALQEVIAVLQQQGIRPLVKQVGPRSGKVLLYAGAFAENDRASADRLAERLRRIKVHGRNDLAGATVFPMPGQ